MESIGLSAAIGRNVAALRTLRGISQVDLAGLVKSRFGLAWSTNTVARVELGHREVLAGELVALGLALGVGPEDLLRAEEPVRLGRGASTPLSSDEVVAWVAGTAGSPDAGGDLQGGFTDYYRFVTEHAKLGEAAQESLLELILAQRLLGDQWSTAEASYFSLWEEIRAQLDEWTRAEEAAGREVTPRRIQGKRAYLWRQAAQHHEAQDASAEPTSARRAAKRPKSPQASHT